MKSLDSIQKTFHVFKVLSKVAMVFCIVIAALCAVGALCVFAVSSGVHVFSLFGQPIDNIVVGNDYNQSLVEMLASIPILVADAILFGFSYSYLKKEEYDKTPFTKSGAKKIRKLGIKYIYIPIIAIIIAETICIVLGNDSLDNVSDFSNLSSVITGIVLILASLIFDYGAELEEKVNNA